MTRSKKFRCFKKQDEIKTEPESQIVDRPIERDDPSPKFRLNSTEGFEVATGKFLSMENASQAFQRLPRTENSLATVQHASLLVS